MEDREPKTKPELTPAQTRVLAALIEKEITTPDQYPLTLRALTAACNQKSNRHPVMALTEEEVTEALDDLRYEQHLVWHVDQAGSRVSKYRHGLLKAYNLNPRDLAVMCELMLRGPQTQGELRTHCERLAPFESVADVGDTLCELSDWAGTALVVQLPPGPGRREPRYAHCLGRPEDLEASAQADAAERARPAAPAAPSREARIAALESELAALRSALAELQAQFDTFRRQFE